MEIDGFVSLGGGYQFYAPGMAGQVHLIDERAGSEDGPARAAALGVGGQAGSAALQSALAINFDRQRTVVVDPSDIRPLHRTELKPSNTAGMMHLRVPVRKARVPRHAVVLAVDEAGTATWNFPRAVSASGPSKAEAPVGVPGSQLLDFEIPYRSLAGDSARESERGPDFALRLPGLSGKKILKVLFFKAADIAVGEIGKFLVSEWENKHRPTRLRWFTPDNFTQAGAGIITKPNDLADLRNQPDKPILLFLHGTFSTSHAGFGELPPKTMKTLFDRYEKRVLAFDHATMVSSPELNLEQLLTALGSNPGMTFDIVSHSRGGLVARGLAGEFGSPSGVRVRRAVMVAAPNHGTALADVHHLSGLLDRMTTALALIPPVGPAAGIAETLSAVITSVKFVGASVASRLQGLTAMDPTGDFIAMLNKGIRPTADYFGVAADYEPDAVGLLALIRGHIVDSTVDFVFGQAANDLVVPELGVSRGSDPDDSVFPLPADRLTTFGSSRRIWHCNYFGAQDTSDSILGWLV